VNGQPFGDGWSVEDGQSVGNSKSVGNVLSVGSFFLSAEDGSLGEIGIYLGSASRRGCC
jgi:hypothetical protein